MLESIFQSGITSALLAQPEPPAIPFHQKGWFVFLLLIAAVALGLFLARALARSLKSVDYQTRMAIVLISISVAGLMIWAKWPPKLGVDLRGGINMIGSLNLEAFLDDNNTGLKPKAKDIIPALIQRVNPSGTKEIMIRPLGDDKIEVTIPSVDPQEADDIWNRLVKTGKLEFRIVADTTNNSDLMTLARKMADQGNRSRRVVELDADGKETTVGVWVSLARLIPEGAMPGDVHPIKFIPQGQNLVRSKSGEIIEPSKYLPLTSADPDDWGRELADKFKALDVRVPQILVVQPKENENVEGKHLATVQSTIDERGRAAVSFSTTAEGGSRMGLLTRLNKDRPMGIVLDGQIHSAPNINSTIISNGVIEGDFTQAEVDELIINLESGKLDVALNKSPISRDFIESNLGQELKNKGIWAIGCSLLLVLVFMLFYYRFAGVVACIALLLNLLLILALIMAINQPLTLTGLAGLVLTVGMSVDANVLIFERIREELDRGAALRMAIRNGFDKATTTIVDANVTTLITAIVLYVIGTEQIKGFSVTLILGILMSMFTAIYVARLFFDVCERNRWLTKLNMTRIMERKQWNFLNKIRITGVVSLLLIAAGLVGMWSLGARILNHDLRGGSTVRMVFKDAQDVDEIRTRLAEKHFKHTDGEELEFSVSGLGNTGDAATDNRTFKVDSNLPAWEGKDSGVEEFKQLDELLQEEFKGELKLHNVEIDGIDLSTNVGAYRYHRSTISAVPSSHLIGNLTAAATGIITYQDEPPVPQETPATSETPPVTLETPTGSEAPTTQETPDATPVTEPDATTTTPAVAPTAQEPAEPATGSTIGASETSGGDFPGGAQAEPDAQPRVTTVTRTMKVTPPVSGKSLRALIQTASAAEELELDEEQIVVDSPDVKEDESADSTISENWEVTMELSDESEADRILSAWGKSFNKKAYFPTTSKVGGQIAGQTQLQALAAIIASLLGIIAYVWIRFQNVAFGLAAVIALIHDVLIVLGAIALSHWLAGALGILGVTKFKISLEIVAALLTVIGYSLNDTIVVFDRVREVRGKRSEITAEMINTSISQTLSRTILTSITTFIVVFILYCFGGEAIHGFAFALVIGVVVGTYSSIFVASPALLWLMNTVGLNPGVVDLAAEK